MIKRIILYLVILFSISCDSNKPLDQTVEIQSVELEFRPSFDEIAFFRLDSESSSVIIQENWRLSVRVDTMYEKEINSTLVQQDWNDLIKILPKDTSFVGSSCMDLDGWRLKGKIRFTNENEITLDFQECPYDTLAHNLSGQILKHLRSSFYLDTITRDYLQDIYFKYYMGQESPIDSVENLNRPLNRLRLDVAQKHFGKKSTGPNNG